MSAYRVYAGKMPARSILLILILLAVAGCSSSTTPPHTPSLPAPSASPRGSASPSPLEPAPSPAALPPTAAVPDDPPHRPTFVPGTLLTTVTDGLRVRSRPWVGDDSARYEPVLPNATMVHALEGPVEGSGYWWYRVELTDGQTLFDGIREGWVAAVAKDGTRWLDVHVDVDPGPTFPPARAGWPSIQVGAVSLTGDFEPANASDLDVHVELRGRLPGSVEFLTARGEYFNEWYCGGGPEGELGAGVTPLGIGSGHADVTAELTIGDDGVGRATIRLSSEPPTEECPAGYPGPKFQMSGRWSDGDVTAPAHGLRLTVPTYEWADTF